jgi:hypothetical protein
MVTKSVDQIASTEAHLGSMPNGAAVAAFLAAGIGGFATGFIVLLNEMSLFTAPTLYEPAGGVSGRTTLAIIVWFVAWVVLHAKWKDREVETGRIALATFALIALGILGTFPPFWGIL